MAFTLARCARGATISHRAGAALAKLHLVRSALVRFYTLIPPSFEDAVRVRASGELYRGWRNLDVLWRLAGLLLEGPRACRDNR